MKAQTPMVGHTIIIAVTVLLILTIVSTLNNLNNLYSDFVKENEIVHICDIIHSSIVSLYDQDQPTLQQDTTLGEIIIELPNDIAGESYTIDFYNKSVRVRVGDKTELCKIGYDVSYTGRSAGGLVKIKWIKGKTTNRIEIGGA